MHWKIKAAIQNAVSHLPEAASYNAYYWMQRNFGGLRRVDPSSRLVAGIETWKKIQNQSRTPSGKVFLEVGTGRVPMVPLAYWLMGARSTISIDLNPYLKEELIIDSIRHIVDNKDDILKLFGDLIDYNRFDSLVMIIKNPNFSLDKFLELCNMHYIAPGDASSTNLPANSIDFHTSYTVFEHIPGGVLKNILMEGNRIISDGGLFVHRIDYSDHFSHSDDGISVINFLQYDDQRWERYAGNKFMYMNRLRHDDFINLFKFSGHKILESQVDVDQNVYKILESGEIKLSRRFSSKLAEVLAVTGSWIVTEKGR